MVFIIEIMVMKEKGMSVARLLGLLSFVEAGCALLFSPVVFALRGVVLGGIAYRLGEKKTGLWGIVANLLSAALGILISMKFSALMDG